jgi:hypothetical protein
MLRENNYLTLTSISTLNRNIRAMRPEFGFDTALLTGLKEKHSVFPVNEQVRNPCYQNTEGEQEEILFNAMGENMKPFIIMRGKHLKHEWFAGLSED